MGDAISLLCFTMTSSLACDCLARISLFGPLVELCALFLVLFSFDYYLFINIYCMYVSRLV